MSTKPSTDKREKRPVLQTLLLIFGLICLIPAMTAFCWYEWTRVTRVDHAAIHARELMVSNGTVRCSLDIPEGLMTVRRPANGAVNAVSNFEAEVELQQPVQLRDCSGALPNWNLQLEAQSALAGTDIEPHVAIRQPLSGRTALNFRWKFIPREEIEPYPSHLWLRLVVMEDSVELERWNLFYHEFEIANRTFFGVSADLTLAGAGVLALLGGLSLALVLLLGHRKSATKQE